MFDSSFRFLPTKAWRVLVRPTKVGLCVGIFAILVVIFMPNTYTSQAEILPASQNPIGGLAAAAAAFGIQAPGGSGDDANYADILDSYWVGGQLLDHTYQFRQRTWRFGKERDYKESLLSYLGAPDIDIGLKALKGVVSTRKDMKTGLLTITVRTESPELSQQIASKATDLLQDFLLHQTQTKGGQTAEFVGERLVNAQGDYAKAERDLGAFMEENRNFENSPDPKIKLKGMRLQAQLDFQRQIIATLMSAREQALTDKANDTPVLNILDHGNLPIEKSGPKRGLIVILVSFIAGLVVLLWEQRDWVKQRMIIGGDLS